MLVKLLLNVLQVAFVFRALFSMLLPFEENALARLLYRLTEPIIIPFRALLGRFPALSRSPIDIPFSVAFLVLILIEYLLPTVTLS